MNNYNFLTLFLFTFFIVACTQNQPTKTIIDNQDGSKTHLYAYEISTKNDLKEYNSHGLTLSFYNENKHIVDIDKGSLHIETFEINGKNALKDSTIQLVNRDPVDINEEGSLLRWSIFAKNKNCCLNMTIAIKGSIDIYTSEQLYEIESNPFNINDFASFSLNQNTINIKGSDSPTTTLEEYLGFHRKSDHIESVKKIIDEVTMITKKAINKETQINYEKELTVFTELNLDQKTKDELFWLSFGYLDLIQKIPEISLREQKKYPQLKIENTDNILIKEVNLFGENYKSIGTLPFFIPFPGVFTFDEKKDNSLVTAKLLFWENPKKVTINFAYSD